MNEIKTKLIFKYLKKNTDICPSDTKGHFWIFLLGKYSSLFNNLSLLFHSVKPHTNNIDSV